MRSNLLTGSLILMTAIAIGLSGCNTVGTAGRATGDAVGSTAEAAGSAAGTAARGAGDIIEDTSEAAERDLD